MPFRSLALLTFGAFLLASTGVWAQEPARKPIYQVQPQYSRILKDKQIGGTVRLVAVVSPAGTVKQTEIVGGNPILVTAAENAVHQWKYAPADHETREEIIFRFDPNNHH